MLENYKKNKLFCCDNYDLIFILLKRNEFILFIS